MKPFLGQKVTVSNFPKLLHDILSPKSLFFTGKKRKSQWLAYYPKLYHYVYWWTYTKFFFFFILSPSKIIELDLLNCLER